MLSNDVADAIMRAAAALERIATALESIGVEREVCVHPVSEREVMPGSSMTWVRYRCGMCGAEGI